MTETALELRLPHGLVVRVGAPEAGMVLADMGMAVVGRVVVGRGCTDLQRDMAVGMVAVRGVLPAVEVVGVLLPPGVAGAAVEVLPPGAVEVLPLLAALVWVLPLLRQLRHRGIVLQRCGSHRKA